jgi:hypothetical protein
MTTPEEIRKMALGHWEYTKGVIFACAKMFNQEIDEDSLELVKYLYIEALIHGYKHAIEEASQ